MARVRRDAASTWPGAPAESPRLRGGNMDIGLVLQNDPPAQRVIDLARRADAGRLHPRVDVRLARAVAGAVRDLRPDPRADLERHGRPDGDQPADRVIWSVTASMFATLNDMFGNRHRLRHRPGRLGRCGCWAASRPPWPPCRGPCGSSGTWPRAGEVNSTARRSASPGSVTAAWRSGWRGYGPKALKLCGERADGFILQWPTRTSPAGRSAPSGRGRGGGPGPGRRQGLRRRARPTWGPT